MIVERGQCLLTLFGLRGGSERWLERDPFGSTVADVDTPTQLDQTRDRCLLGNVLPSELVDNVGLLGLEQGRGNEAQGRRVGG